MIKWWVRGEASQYYNFFRCNQEMRQPWIFVRLGPKGIQKMFFTLQIWYSIACCGYWIDYKLVAKMTLAVQKWASKITKR